MPVIASVSEDHLVACIVSAEFWTTHINVYADRMQNLADRYAISASLISTLTGLSVWGTVTSATEWWGQAAVSLMAFLAAAAAVVPKIRGYGECAFKAMPLAAEYGRALGELRDALGELKTGNHCAQAHAQAAISAFEKIKERKDALKPFPAQLEEEINRLREMNHQPAV